MTKLVIALGGAGLAALGVMLAVAVGGTGGGSTPTLDRATTVGTTTGVSTTTTGETTTAETTTTAEATTTGVDISGPCDEAEHRNDPRCTGAATVRDDRDDDGEHRGRNRGRGSDDDDHDDDRSGSNSGRG
jgi:hypothetical protein